MAALKVGALVDVLHIGDWLEGKVKQNQNGRLKVHVIRNNMIVDVPFQDVAPFRTESSWKTSVQVNDLVEAEIYGDFVLVKCTSNYDAETDSVTVDYNGPQTISSFYMPGTWITNESLEHALYLQRLVPGDHVDAHDGKLWCEAVVREISFPSFLVHFRGWHATCDKYCIGVTWSYSRVADWRSALREGSDIELMLPNFSNGLETKQRLWHAAIVVSVQDDDIVIKCSRLDKSCRIDDHLEDTICVSRQSERICAPRTHLRNFRRDGTSNPTDFDAKKCWGANHDEIQQIRMQRNSDQIWSEDGKSEESVDQKAEHSALECAVCLQNRKTVLFHPCMHLCCCNECSGKLQKCPICRRNISSRNACIV